MNFDFSEDQKLLQKTVQDYLAEHSPLSVCRAILEGKERYSEELWKGAAEMGWLGAAVPEEYGGAGFGQLELVLIAQEIGRSLAPIPFSSSVYLATEALLRLGSDELKKKHLPGLVAGDRIGCYAVAENPGQVSEKAIQVRYENGALTGTKVPVQDGDVAGLAVVLARSASGLCLVIADLDDSSVTRESLESLDPARSQGKIRFAGTPAEQIGADGQGWEQHQTLLNRAAVMMAFEQVGVADRALDITREYTMGRFAFGRPIASFQALKHNMADTWAEIELARSNAYYGAWALSADAPELAEAACTARVAASTAAERATSEMIQLHGGVGFTWEYDCHLFYRRAKLLSLALGGPSEWREKLVQQLEA